MTDFKGIRSPDEHLIDMLNGDAICTGCRGTGRWTVEQRAAYTRKPMPRVSREIDGEVRLVTINPDTPCNCVICGGSGRLLVVGEARKRCIKLLADVGIEVVFVDQSNN